MPPFLQPQDLPAAFEAAWNQHDMAAFAVQSIVFPAFGRSAAQGHSFAYAGAALWFPEVLAFMQRHCNAMVDIPDAHSPTAAPTRSN